MLAELLLSCISSNGVCFGVHTARNKQVNRVATQHARCCASCHQVGLSACFDHMLGQEARPMHISEDPKLLGFAAMV